MAMAAAIAAAFLFGLARAYRTLANVELVALWWWAAIAALAFAGTLGPTYLLLGLAGVLMIGLGLFVAFNVRGIADRLAGRRMGLGPFWKQRSAAYWRFSGCSVAVIGGFWTLALGSVF
jgi:hypothetical protein